jgi:hypothetical protein
LRSGRCSPQFLIWLLPIVRSCAGGAAGSLGAARARAAADAGLVRIRYFDLVALDAFPSWVLLVRDPGAGRANGRAHGTGTRIGSQLSARPAVALDERALDPHAALGRPRRTPIPVRIRPIASSVSPRSPRAGAGHARVGDRGRAAGLPCVVRLHGVRPITAVTFRRARAMATFSLVAWA